MRPFLEMQSSDYSIAGFALVVLNEHHRTDLLLELPLVERFEEIPSAVLEYSWLYDEEAVDVLRHFTRLKNRLMPYLYGAAVTAHVRGVPVMRAMPLAFPEDRGCDTLDRQYMLGDSLLVAPVLSSDGVVDYYLPAGRWTNLLNGNVIKNKH